MDPNATLEEIKDHFAKGNYFSAAISFKDLDHWLSSGGFLPAVWMKHRKDTL